MCCIPTACRYRDIQLGTEPAVGEVVEATQSVVLCYNSLTKLVYLPHLTHVIFGPVL